MKMKVSVIIPVYNAEKFLDKAARSALILEEVQEILLIEDGSNDNSLQICKNLAANSEKIKLIQHHDKGNHGAGATRNLGLESATAEFIAFLDADDYYLPDRFETDKKLFENPDIEGVFNAIGTEFLTEKGRLEFQEKFKTTQLTTVKKHAEGKDVFYGLLGLDNSFGNFFHLNGLTVRTESIRKNGLRFNESLRVHQDSDFIIKLSYHCNLKSGNISEAVAVRGVHDDNRITKIKLYSDGYNKRQLLLWTSISDWADTKELSPDYKRHILLQKESFEISQKTGLQKYFRIASSVIRNPNILKTRYRFTYLNK